MAVTFHFYLFGPPRLLIDERNVVLPPQPAAFVSFLLLNRQRRITREEVQAAFWPDAAPEKAQERLRRTLYLLRQAIHPHTDLIATEGNELAIAPEANLRVDYEEFERALMNAYRTDLPARQLLSEAVALYKDDLLKDIYADWVLLEREHAHQRFLTALRHLILVCQQAGDWSGVIEYAHRLREQDPLQETAYRALMMAYYAMGDRSAAIRHYQQCVEMLDQELAAEPMPETTQLYEDIRQGQAVIPVVLPSVPSVPVPVATDLDWVPLVGRDEELARITLEWRICQRNKSQLLLITGPAGMGKTRLVEEAISRIPGPNVAVLIGNCYAMEAGTPYQLIAELMRQAVDRIANRLSATTRQDLAQLVPTLKSGSRLETATRLGMGPDASILLQEAVTEVVRLLASSGDGLWLVTEDLHWADPASLACLNHALRRCHDLPLMVLATLRDEEVSYDSPLMDWPTSSVHAPAPTTLIRLPPLPQDELQRLLAELVKEDLSSFAPLLYRETAGNPFFVVETLRALVEQGLLYEKNGNWQLRAGALPDPADLPMSETALGMIRGRVRRLSRAAQEVLTIAAVVEHDIDEKMLAVLAEPSVAVDLALEELLKAFILEETSPGLYQFCHIKVREIMYADTSAPRRRFLHRHTADYLAQHGGTRNLGGISKLAYHYGQAREWTQALVNHWWSAHTALLAGAMAEANRYAEQAQRILDEHASEVDTSNLPEPLPAIQFDLFSLRAEFLRQAATAGLYYPPDMMEAMDALTDQIDEARQARASLQQAIHLLGQGKLTGAKEAAERGRALYSKVGDLLGELDATQHQIDIAYRAGDMVLVRFLMTALRRLGQTAVNPEIRRLLDENEMRFATYEGRWMDVLHLAQKLSSRTSGLDPALAWLSQMNLGIAYMKLGNFEEAYDVAQHAVEVSKDAGVLGLGAQVLLARLELWRGNNDIAVQMLLDLLESPHPLMGEVEMVPPALALVRCYVVIGDDDGAKKWAKRASKAMSQIQLPILYPLSQVAWALADIAASRYEDARKSLNYPIEYMLLLEDTSPQEILALRAAAELGLGNHEKAAYWIGQASAVIQQQADQIEDAHYRTLFLNRVPLHQFIESVQAGAKWQPQEALCFQDQAGEWTI